MSAARQPAPRTADDGQACAIRTRLPAGSRNAQSRAPQGCDAGSWSTSAPDARTFSNVRVEVLGAEDRGLQRPLRHQRQEGVAFDLRATAVRLEQDDVDVLPRGADGDPAEAVGRDVGADLEAERVPVEAERGVGVVDGDEHGGHGDCHGTTVGPPTRRALLRSCSVPAGSGGVQTVTRVRRGRVATLLTQDGTTSRSRWSRARYCDGVSPTTSVKRELNEPSDVQPTATQVSVTDIP